MMTNLLHGAHVANKLFSTIARLRLLLVMFLTLTVSANAWGEETTLEINTTNFTKLSGSGYAAYNGEREIDGVTIYSYQVMVQSSKIQFQKSNGILYNKTPLPGNISKISIATPDNLTIYVGEESNPSSTTVQSGNTITGNNKYFAIKASSSATPTTATITITYEVASGDNEEGEDSTCDRWVEVDVSSIESTDAVMITMHHGTAPNETIYALNSSKGTSSAPPATEITPTQLATKNWSSDNLLWNIETDTNGKLILHPNGTSNNLYCNTSNSNDRIRIGNSQNALTNHQFTIEKDYLKFSNENKTYYIGVYVGSPDWRGYTSTSSNIAGQTLKFYKYVECTTETTYSVTYNGNGNTSGSVPTGATEYAKDAQVTVLGNTGNLAKTGYTFSGWNTKDDGTGTPYTAGETFTITEETTLYAQWTANTHTITLDANGGSGNTTSVAATYDSSTLNPSSITNPTKTGHTFGGWYSGEGGTGSLVINTSGKLQANVSGYTGANGVWKATTNETLYAKWTPSVYTITYKDQGNATFSGTHESGNPTQHTYGTETTLKGATKTGYTFGGWYKEATCTNKVTSLGTTEYTANITLYAQWTANTYTVKFDGNGSDGGSMTDQSFTYGQSQALSANAFTRTNYSFKHWTINQDGTGISYTDKQSVSNLTAENGATVTLYAQWTPTYTITWLANEQVHHTQTAVEGTTLQMPSTPADGSYSCDDKVFVGWTENQISGSTNTKPADLFTNKSGTLTVNKTYYAVFATAEGVASTDYTKITDINNLTDGNYVIAYGYNTTTPSIILKATTNDETTLVATSASPSSNKYQNPAAENIWTIKKNGTTYTLYNETTSKYVQANTTPALLLADANPTNFNIEYSTDHWKIKINGNTSYQLVGYTNASGNYFQTKSSASGSYKIQLYKNTSTVSYSDYTTTCVKLPDPVWEGATIDKTALSVNCGERSPMTGQNGAAKITFPTEKIYNFTKDIKIEATSGFLVSTSQSVDANYKSSVFLSPLVGTANANTFYEKPIYVRAEAPAQSDTDLEGTITIKNSNGETLQTFSVTADVTCTQYTISFSVTGATEMIEPTTFYAGGDWELPENPNVECEGREFVGWTTNPIIGTQDNEPNPLCSTKADFQDIEINDNITFYAVFATEGGGTGDWQKVTTTGDVKDGETYLIISFDGTYYLPNAQATSNPPKTKTATKQNGNITVTDEMKWIATASDGGFTFTSYSNNEYYLWGGNANDATRIKDISNTKNATKVWFVENHTTYGVVIYHNASEDGTKYLSTNGSSDWRNYVNNTLSNNNRAANLYKYSNSGSSSGYSNYATSCASIKGIRIEGQTTTFNQHTRFDFGGTVYAIDQNDNEIDVTSLATFSGYDMSQTGTQTVTVTYQHFTVTYEITINEVDAWTVTWNVSGATNTGIGPRHVVKGTSIGDCSSTGDIQIPDVPTGEYCEDKVFVGWTDSNTVPADGGGIDFINKNTTPNSDITYYAVFAESNGGGSGNYEKVTASLTDYSGEYLIVYETDALAFNGGSTTLDAARNTITVTIDNNTIEATDATNAAKFTIAKTQDGYTIKSANGYYIGQTSNANGLLASTSTAHINTISIADGNANIISSGVAYLRYNATSGQERFRYFKSDTYTNQKPIALYKKSDGIATYTNYTTGCHDCIISYYGFKGGYTTSCDGDLNHFTQRVNSAHTIPNCGTITDPLGLNREFLNLWNTQPNGGKEFEPGTTFILTQDTTFYAQWALNTSSNITLPTDVEDLANTDIVVTGGNTLTLGAGTTTIKSLTLKGGIQADGSYKMPIIYIPDDATLKRKSDIIYLDLVVNAKNYYPFAVPFRAKNGSAKADWDYVGYIDPVLKEAATYRTHFVIKTYDGAKRAENGENRDANWVIVNQDTYLEPGIGYMITAMTYAGKNTVTMRIPMRVSWRRENYSKRSYPQRSYRDRSHWQSC